ncbi:acyltransferase domain-containing protein [Streptomyces sp. SPB074]|uniref:acyltransferase domain-containing protein n=1 Tax=Streptomyces sp. (strain SPB074) TaxID=465543 RepID=UPI00017F11EC|nr:acyltransferase domain-containing protein [Streptomyces sp. SPB074]EDY42528.2 modular polyketide synthase [Streptomyces sp. SPB074]
MSGAGAPRAGGPLPVALLLPGQGSQHVRMAAGLYGHEPVFGAAMDDFFAAAGAEGEALRRDWLAEHPGTDIDHVTRSQPLLFAVGHALGRMVLGRGLRPAVLLGHSIGEMAAATLAGVFRPRDATDLVLDRVRRLAGAAPGGMVAVAASAAEVAPYLRGQVVVGAVNAPRQTVLAGPDKPLGETGRLLRAAGFVCRRVPSLSPFHSPVLEPACRGAAERFAAVERRMPSVPVRSAYTAAPLTRAEIGDPGFWARQPVAPVLFWPALDALLGSGDHLLVEVGPGQGLSAVARRHPAVRRGTSAVVSLLPARPGTPEADRAALDAALRRLEAAGHPAAGETVAAHPVAGETVAGETGRSGGPEHSLA